MVNGFPAFFSYEYLAFYNNYLCYQRLSTRKLVMERVQMYDIPPPVKAQVLRSNEVSETLRYDDIVVHFINFYLKWCKMVAGVSANYIFWPEKWIYYVKGHTLQHTAQPSPAQPSPAQHSPALTATNVSCSIVRCVVLWCVTLHSVLCSVVLLCGFNAVVWCILWCPALQSCFILRFSAACCVVSPFLAIYYNLYSS